jgi:hypothetical protein
MGSKWRTIPVRDLDRYERQFRALHKDWRYFHKLVEAYADPRADNGRRKALEIAFLELKGRVSCDYTVLAAWRNGACGIPSEISDIFAERATLRSLSDDLAGGGGRTEEEWHEVDEALGYVRQVLVECRGKLKPGKPAKLPAELFSSEANSHAVEHHLCLCRALQGDWARVRALLVAFGKPGANRRELEDELLRLKSKMACDYPTLPSWFGGRDETSTGLGRIMDGSATLASLADGPWMSGRTGRDWQAVDTSIGDIRKRLVVARGDLERGKPVELPDGIMVQSVRRPFPVKKFLKLIAVFVLIGVSAGGVHFLRNFVGVGAPAPGEGLDIPMTMEDEEQITTLLMVMDAACVQASVDKFMTAIAYDFEDDEGNGRRALRVVLQAYHTKGDFGHARVLWARTEFTRIGDWIYANPVIFQPNVEGEKDLYMRLGFKQRSGRWLISKAEGYS